MRITHGQVPCPKCGHPLSRILRTKETRRYRRCHSCHRQFITIEVNADMARMLTRIIAALTPILKEKSDVPQNHQVPRSADRESARAS